MSNRNAAAALGAVEILARACDPSKNWRKFSCEARRYGVKVERTKDGVRMTYEGDRDG